MTPTEQIISAKMTSSNDIVLPTPRGSGNVIAIFSNAAHLATPWLINISPITIRAVRSNADERSCEGAEGKSKFLRLDIIPVFNGKYYLFADIYI